MRDLIREGIKTILSIDDVEKVVLSENNRISKYFVLVPEFDQEVFNRISRVEFNLIKKSEERDFDIETVVGEWTGYFVVTGEDRIEFHSPEDLS